MISKTQIIKNQEVIVRFLNDDGICVDGFRDIDEKHFDFAFRRVQGDVNFNMGIPSFGNTTVEKYNWTTLTNEQLESKNITI